MKKTKKVLIFVPEFPNLTETFIYREISKLAERPLLDVVVLSLKSGSAPLPKNLESRTFYRRLSFSGCVKSLPYFFRFKQIRQAFKLIVDNPNRNILETLYILIKGVCYSRIFDEYNPDLIIAHFLSESTTLALIISKVTKTPLAISAHAKDILQEESNKKDENAELLKQKVENSEFILICNKNALEALKENCDDIDCSHIYLQYHGVDFDALENRKFTEMPKKPEKPTILFIGRFVEKKGLKYLIQASQILLEKNLDHVIKIIGLGPLYEDLNSMIKSLGMEDTIQIIGEGKGLPFEEASKYYKIADVFVFPAIRTDTGDEDGIANVLVEAAAYKLPVVATTAGSTQELIINEKTGLVVDQRSPEKLADAIRTILENPEESKEYAENLYSRARDILSVEENVKDIEKLILEV